MSETMIEKSRLLLEKGDITTIETEAIVFYAQHDLVLGSGFGNAITVRGGNSIQEELKKYGNIKTCEAVITGAGNLKSQYIIHAVGPRFEEPDTDEKLRNTMQNVLKIAKKNNIKKIAFPPMGTGFYGVPLDLCARVMLEVIKNQLLVDTLLEEVLICVIDEREYNAFWKIW